ncbi:MAG: RT0821/Lpp0805 family surface protein [Rickettsiaceae bacterium]
MKKLINVIICSVVTIFTLQSCATKEQTGTLIGGLAGAALGSQFGKGGGQIIGTALGAGLGMFIGNQIGQNMDETDKLKANQASQNAMENTPSGKTVEWKNPDNGNHGSITPKRTFKREGRYCREYTQRVVVGGKEQQAYGTACRQPDGSWEVVNEDK